MLRANTLESPQTSPISECPHAMTPLKATDLHLALQSPSSLLDSPPASVANDSNERSNLRSKHANSESPSELFLGTLTVSLPSGEILQVTSESSKLSEFVDVGGNLLGSLHGKGGRILMMQAFCGGSNPRMYARLKNNSRTLSCSLICDFKKDEQNPDIRICSVNVYAVEFVRTPQAGVKCEFITRHNSNCNLIYFDSASVPFLGHFPSEKTGSSLFSIVHPDDVAILERVHQDLKAGIALARCAGLRLITFDGRICVVDSEWAAFTNPWTGLVEMVVAKHTVVGLEDDTTPKVMALDDTKRCDMMIRRILENTDDFVTKPDVVQNTGVHTPPLTKNSGSSPGSPDLMLSYTQMSCLDNVRRLLSSQKTSDHLVVQNSTFHTSKANGNSAPLTKELLNLHDRRWEAVCKGTWHRRLQKKRPMSSADGLDAQKKPKVEPNPSPLLANALGHTKPYPQPQLVNYLNALFANPQTQTMVQSLLGHATSTQSVPPC
ncbi:unnamed protein product [Bursaphelenchus xylophilus]|uniref:(pine wood nematode) hypothetical protein n=1 Tax=Bursaphelenchus xylophilus TaxID=6326 RepID=A0A1I7SS79_BURXY|nr:unnamed protein product [Bursaphelenchus xylophilus]CAG9097955.1 unnamed protein product [Bursaphelenchus xylophilus]